MDRPPDATPKDPTPKDAPRTPPEAAARSEGAARPPSSAAAPGAGARSMPSRPPGVTQPGTATRALVPAVPPQPGRFGRWVRRVTGFVRTGPAPASVPPELREKIRGLESRLAAHEEHTNKRLAEGEARVLHLLEQRVGRLESELAASLREVAAREVERRTAGLRTRLALVALLALGAGGAAALALLRLFDVPLG